MAGGRSSIASDGGLSQTVHYLEEGRDKMEALGYSGAPRDDDQSIHAFDSFNTGLARCVNSAREEDDQAVAELEPKDKVLQFLVQIHRSRRTYQRRIVWVIDTLLAMPSWKQVVDSDPELKAALAELTTVEKKAEDEEQKEVARLSFEEQDRGNTAGGGPALVVNTGPQLDAASGSCTDRCTDRCTLQ